MSSKEKGVFSQFITLFKRDLELFLNDRVKLVVTLVLPVAIGLVITAVTNNKDVGKIFETTKSTLFTVISAAIYTGMFNSLTLICKERSIIKREYMTGMKLTSFVYSNVALQAMICAVQTCLFMFVYWVFPQLGLSHGNSVFVGNALTEYTVCLFLIMMASDMMGMFISSIVKSNEIANLTAPIIIIIQLVMSGVLFELKGMMDRVASFTVSKWGMQAMGRVADLASLPSKINNTDFERPKIKIDPAFKAIPQPDGTKLNGTKEIRKYINEAIDETIEGIADASKGDTVKEIYEAAKGALLHDWLILLLFILVLSVLCIIALRRVSKDQR